MSTAAVTGTWNRLTTSALALGVVHGLVDCASGFVVFRDVGGGGYTHGTILTLVVLYNALAFGGQAFAGLLADRLNWYRGMAATGAALAAAALVIAPWSTWGAIVVVGVGNALFHVGAGAHVLAASGDRATESGVFVGPGALGLAAGIWLGSQAVPARLVIAALLVLSAPILLQIGKRAVRTTTTLPRVQAGLLVVVVVCAMCLVGSVTVRALVGGTVAGAWRGVSPEVMWALAIAAMSGKMLGGFIGDRLGWATTSVAALVISAPLISFLVGTPWGAVAGMLVFQMTMPMTLKAMHHVMPERPGLAFGIPCMALLAGALPGLFGVKLFPEWTWVLGTALITAAVVGVGLVLLVRTGASAGPARDWLARVLAPAAAAE